MNALSMHLTASNINAVLIHMVAIRLVFKKYLDQSLAETFEYSYGWLGLGLGHQFEICAECDCKPGFNRIGAECIDADECKGNPCPYANEVCHNTDGSFYCDCEIGYQERGSEGWSG